jgi:hypothetical protein
MTLFQAVTVAENPSACFENELRESMVVLRDNGLSNTGLINSLLTEMRLRGMWDESHD